MKYVIGTRGSKLALVQAEGVCDRLRKVYPEHTFEIQVIRTKGDRITGKPLHEIGGKGLFVTEIEKKILTGEVHIGVHSMKDMPAVPEPGLCFTKAWKREDARDALVLREAGSLDELPQGAVIGTGSLRRGIQMRMLRPDIRIVGIRGNVDTRLRKMEEEKLDGVILAAAGLHRLGLRERITCYLEPVQMIPAPAQGVLALEILEGDTVLRGMLDALSDKETEETVIMERGFLQKIGADCHVPVGAFGRKCSDRKNYELQVLYGNEEGTKLGRATVVSDTPEGAAEQAVREIRKKLAGTVYLVGAGPGDPGLITVKGMQILREADCIVYDRLIPPELLAEAKEGCELIYVGKENHHHTMKQEDINRLLIQKGMQYGKTVRLKGGDIYVLGRGGEEGLALSAEGIPFEIVPGITSAIAGPAYAGIPVTHRGMAGGFHVVSAHDRRDGLADIDFQAIARDKETCIFLMGLGMLGEITEKLRKAGMPGTTEAAVISKAATSEQQVCVADLQTIQEKVKKAGLTSPALIVIGHVVHLRESLNVMEQRELSGRNYIVTRIGKQTSEITKELRLLGAGVREVQTGEIVRHPVCLTENELVAADWIVFTSRHGVEAFFENMDLSGVDVRALSGIKVAAVGKKTAQSLERHHIRSDFVPEREDGDSLADGLQKRLAGTERVWCVRPENTESPLRKQLESKCQYQEIYMYENRRTVQEEQFTDIFRTEMSGKNTCDGIVFTCASSVHRLVKSLTGEQRKLLDSVTMFSIGNKTTEALRTHGMERIVQAECADYKELVKVIKESAGIAGTRTQ